MAMFISEFKILGTLFWLVYVAVAGGLIYAAVRKPGSLRGKVSAAVVVVLAFSVLPVINAKEAVERKLAQAESAKYREAAWAHFRKRCKENAGEKISKVIEDVKGIYLQRPREKPKVSDLRDQYWMGDPYGLVTYPPAEISRYLNYLDDKGIPTKKRTARQGFKYVITRRLVGQYLEYRLDVTNEDLITRNLEIQPSRYSVTWSDISTDEDRKYWVAGGQLRIVDLATTEVLGERIGYVIESGFGSTAGGRVPWLIARRNACPPIERNVAKDRLFVERVLRPMRRESDDK